MEDRHVGREPLPTENPMEEAADTLTPVRLLEVRTVEVISGRGRSITLSNVRCPVRDRSTAVEECAHCGRSDGVARDALARGEWLCCRTAVAGEPASGGPRVREVMRREAVALRPGVSRAVAADALRARGQGSAPVVDGEGRPVGVVGEAELLRAGGGAKVADAMVRVALGVAETAPLSRAAALMVSHGVDRVAVVSADGIVVGVLSALDVVGWLAAPGGALASEGDGAGS
jgi:CBS domain-containing protein